MGEGRLSNVAVAIVARDCVAPESEASRAVRRAARLAADLFEEVVLIGSGVPPDAPGRRVPTPATPDPLTLLVTALDAVQAERVWVLDPSLAAISADLLLGLVAWPEADAVDASGGRRFEALFALYRREPVRARARARLGTGADAVSGLLGEIGASRLGPRDLERLSAEPDAASARSE